jgi:hypothetical protein
MCIIRTPSPQPAPDSGLWGLRFDKIQHFGRFAIHPFSSTARNNY